MKYAPRDGLYDFCEEGHSFQVVAGSQSFFVCWDHIKVGVARALPWSRGTRKPNQIIVRVALPWEGGGIPEGLRAEARAERQKKAGG